MTEAKIQSSGNAPAFFNSRATVILTSIIAFVFTVLFLAPHSAPILFAVLLTDGFVTFAWILCAAAAGAVVLKCLNIRANPMLFLSTAAGLGLGIFSLLALGLGLLGLLNRATSIALPIFALLSFVLVWRRDIRNQRLDLQTISNSLRKLANLSWLWLIPVISLAFAVVAASVMPGLLWKPLDPHPYDVLSYHLQVPREWYELGRIVPLHHNVFSYFPFNVEMQYLLLMHFAGGPWNAMYMCQYLSVGYAVLTIIAIAGAITPQGKPVIGAAIAAAVPWLMMLAGVAYVEAALLLYTTLAIAWGMRAIDSDSENSSVRNWLKFPAIAGVMAGLACGVKITAVPMLLAAIPVALVFVSVIQRTQQLKKTITQCLIFLAVGSVVLSPWLIRNAIWAGNPLFPVAMKTLGHDHFSPDQIERFRIAHSPTPAEQSLPARLQIVWTDILTHWQFGYILLPAGLLTALCNLKDRRIIFLLVTAAISLFVWIAFTHLLARFLVILIPMAAIALGQFPWKKFVPVPIALVSIAAISGWANVFQPLTAVTRDPVKSAFIAREDLSFMIPPELADMTNSTKQVALVGDAQAFLFQIPMDRLHYRTIFDINSTDPFTAWLPAEAKNSPDWLLVINPAEIERLNKTYWKTPALPPQWNTPDRLPFVRRGDVIK